MRLIRWLLVFSLSFFLLDCAKAGTYFLNLRYQSVKEFPSLQQKVGATMGMAPFKDERPDPSYIGVHTSLQGDPSYFKSRPFPLEGAIRESLSDALTRLGVKIIPISDWDGRPESLKDMETDSVLAIEMKRFWTEGKASVFRTTVKTTVQFVFHLGMKKENKVYTRNVEVEKEMTLARSTPEGVETMVNQILTEIFDAYFSNPY